MHISVGQKFPNFSGRTYDGQYFDFEALIGRNLVVYFYPKDDTPGCAIEAQEFSQSLNQFHKANTEVIGISVDTLDSHRKFAGKYKLKVSLISDSEKQLVEKLGIKRENGLAMRATFIIDKQGKVRKIYENVNPNGHAHYILGYIEKTMTEKPGKMKQGGRARIRKTKVLIKPKK